MGERLESITILGGGTAGWLAAAMIDAARNRRNDGPDLKIALIESPRIPTVGVGEATTLSMVWTLDLLALDERDFIQKCDVSLKAGVKFANWDRKPDGSPSWYIHPFESPPYIHGMAPAYHYHKRVKAGARLPPLAHCMVALPAILEANKAPRKAEAGNLDGLAAYAYHVDAGLFAGYLRDYCTTMGVSHVSDDVIGVEQDERGFVTALNLKEGGRHPVEFVIDSSGFAGEIIRKTLNEPFETYGDSLLCDRAVAVQVPHGTDEPLRSYTRSTGLNAGWMWEVPLYSRRGHGYVYSSRFSGEDEALKELLDAIGVDEADVRPNFIKMNIGRSRRSWVKNCLAIGLAGGFIEPLESTSIHFVQMALRWFLDNFPDRDCSPALADSYNVLTRDLYEDIRDFIVMHYCTSNRRDTGFWRTAGEDLAIPDALKAKLERFRCKLPSVTDSVNRLSLFSEWSYIYVLYGKGYFNGITFPEEDFICDDDFEAFSLRLDRQRSAMMAEAPDHRDLLNRIRREPAAPWYRPEGLPELQSGDAAIA